MPRKKKIEATEETAAAAAPDNTIEKPKARRKKAEEPVVQAAPAPEPEAPPATTSPKKGRRQVEAAAVESSAPDATAEPAKKRPSRSKKALAEAVLAVPEPEPVIAHLTPEAAPADEPAKMPRSRKRPSTAIEAPVEAAPAEEPSPVKPKATKSRKSERSPAADPGPTPLDELLASDADLPVPIWRPRTAPPPPPAPATAATDEDTVDALEPLDESKLAPRKSRRRRGRGRDREGAPEESQPSVQEAPPAVEAAAAEPRPARERGRSRRPSKAEEPAVVAPPVPEPPSAPQKPLIPVPADAPQVVLRDGVPTLVRDQKVFPPIMFFGSSTDERRAQTVLEEARLAGGAGVEIVSHLIEFEVDPSAVDGAVQLAAYMLAKTLEVSPGAQVIFRTVFIAPRNWADKYPRGKYVAADGALAEPSICDDDFWDSVEQCLDIFVKKLRLLESRDHILGVHLERGEWFFGEGWGYDTSPAARQRFRDWARMRYANDIVALRAAWFDGDAEFETLEVPPYQEKVSDKFVRSSRKERKWVDYHLFLSDATVQRIGSLAYCAKQASNGYFLVGASYGYTFEWSHPGSGHLSLGKLLRTPEIDFIAGPPSYKSREPGGAAPFPGPIDSFSLNGKLYISEEDFKTAIGQGYEPDDFNPVIKTPQALESVHWRGAGTALAHGSGMCWMDLWGNGWLRTHTIWQRGARVREALTHRMAAPMSDPDVAVFIDERALAYLVDQKAFALLVQNVRESILRSGLSAGFYLLSDLQHREMFPESKLYVFVNAWDIRSELRSAIKQRLQRDGKVLFWLYAAALFDSGRDSLERAREVTGIALKPQPFHSKVGTAILNRRHPLCEALGEKGLVSGVKLEPSYFAIPEEATVLGEYSQTGLPSFLIKEFKGDEPWTSVFLGEPLVTPGLIRALGQMAGAHVWNFQEDVVHVRAPFLTVHCTGAGPRTITLPAKWAAYNLLSEEWVQTDATSLRFQANDGSTHVFLVGVREELEAILQTDPDALLKIEELPAKPDNTTRFDADMFDVPVVKLGEWMETGSEEEFSDDILLRPQLVVDERSPDAEPSADGERSGRRRRRRRRGGGAPEFSGDRGEPTEEGARPRKDRTEEAFDAELGMSVMFRKRE